MPRMTRLQMLVANLRGDFPEGAVGYVPRAEAHSELVRRAGMDVGLDPQSWEEWIKSQKRVRPRLMTSNDIRRELRLRRGGERKAEP